MLDSSVQSQPISPKSFAICRSAIRDSNPFIICSYKTLDLKSFSISSYKKTYAYSPFTPSTFHQGLTPNHAPERSAFFRRVKRQRSNVQRLTSPAPFDPSKCCICHSYENDRGTPRTFLYPELRGATLELSHGTFRDTAALILQSEPNTPRGV